MICQNSYGDVVKCPNCGSKSKRVVSGDWFCPDCEFEFDDNCMEVW